ncbi:hypothetical protein Glove_299g37 [Diversispora epigaea]|uniref:Protein kinase domain-containing protein n=1 Tax=Diversispora epigaea TaxID=1348612 RepID=A0A397HYD7_9GLOM|nr:hypothetical protein Glove_299g37 [Diversispora epigaea]
MKLKFQWYLKSAEGEIIWDRSILEIRRRYLKSAEGGKHLGQVNLGNCYQHGIGTTKDEKKVFLYYLKSAEGGDNNGQCNLGYCYQHGIGTTKDEKKAFLYYLKSAEGKDRIILEFWHLKSAEGENPFGQNNLGNCYRNGIGTTKDKEKAFQCCYNYGIGTTKDKEKTFQWCLKSAEGGNHPGQSNLGNCYYFEIGTKEDEGKAFQWGRQNNLGNCYNYGIGTTKDKEKAFQWYLKSAEGENHKGQNNLGNCYYIGIGTTEDEGKAFQWYLKSAEGRNHKGQNNLGNCYRDGIGTTKDKAFHIANFDLGYCYENGIGTIKDEEEAFKWYSKSSEKEQISIEYCHRNEIGISKIKNKLKHRCQNCENLNIKNNICSNYDNAKEWEIWRWINYSKFKDIKHLAKGGFGSIWKAEWIDMPEELFEFYKSNQVAFKKLKDSQEISPEFLKELIANFHCRDKYVLPILDKRICNSLRYMKNGNLRDFLKQNKSLLWIERLWLLNSFIRGLKVIHNRGFIHRDLHPGNLMITEIGKSSKASRAYGILPYIAPEVLNKYQYTQASDIYSVGIIMWIISTGKIPFALRAYDTELAADIFNGLRPKINRGTPQCYVELMEKCWHKNTAERPNAEMIFYQEMQDEELSSSETTHSEAYLTSHLLPSLSHIQPSILKFDVNKMNFNFDDN